MARFMIWDNPDPLVEKVYREDNYKAFYYPVKKGVQVNLEKDKRDMN